MTAKMIAYKLVWIRAVDCINILPAMHSKLSVHATNITNIYTTNIGYAYLVFYRIVLNRVGGKKKHKTKKHMDSVIIISVICITFIKQLLLSKVTYILIKFYCRISVD